MKRETREALAICLARLEAGESVEACLRGHEALAAELRPLLEAASAVRGFTIEPYSPEGFQGGRSRLRSAVRRTADRRPGGYAPGWPLIRAAAALAVATVVAAVALLAFTTDVFRFGAGQTEAVEGVVESVDNDTWRIRTSSGEHEIKVDADTPVVGGGGEELRPGDIQPGTSVRFRDDDEDGSADSVEIVGEELEGTITAINGSDLTVETSSGAVLIRLGQDTDVEGTLAVGAPVKAHGSRQPDGVFLAREIEVSGADGGDTGGGDDGGGSGGPGGGDDSGGGGSGGGDD